MVATLPKAIVSVHPLLDQGILSVVLIRDAGIWQSFSQQFAAHRLGLGIFVTKAVAIATGWNVRAEAFAVAFMLLLIALAAIYLKWRLFKSLTLWDALIPLICLSTPQIAATTLMPFPAYSATPVLLLMLYAICLTLQDVRLRYGILAVLNFLLVFSVWGVFVGFLSPVLLVSLVPPSAGARLKARRWAGFAPRDIDSFTRRFPSLTTILIAMLLASVFPLNPLVDYFWFVAHMFSYPSAHFAGLGVRPSLKSLALW